MNTSPRPMYCEECHRVETDFIMLDGEICGACGGFLSALDVDRLREDRIERNRLADEDDGRDNDAD